MPLPFTFSRPRKKPAAAAPAPTPPLYSLFDDFDDGVVSGSKYEQPGGTITEANGCLIPQVWADGAQCPWLGGSDEYAPIWTLPLVSISCTTVEIKAKLIHFAVGSNGGATGLGFYASRDNAYMLDWHETNKRFRIKKLRSNVHSIVTTTANDISSTPQTVNQIFKLIWNKNTNLITFNYSLNAESSFTELHSLTSEFTPTHVCIFTENFVNGPTALAKWDWLSIRMD